MHRLMSSSQTTYDTLLRDYTNQEAHYRVFCYSQRNTVMTVLPDSNGVVTKHWQSAVSAQLPRQGVLQE